MNLSECVFVFFFCLAIKKIEPLISFQWSAKMWERDNDTDHKANHNFFMSLHLWCDDFRGFCICFLAAVVQWKMDPSKKAVRYSSVQIDLLMCDVFEYRALFQRASNHAFNLDSVIAFIAFLLVIIFQFYICLLK